MNIEETEKLVHQLHEGQTDKAGRPYIEHLLRVRDRAESIARQAEMDENEVSNIAHAALLHDAIEDTSATAESLLAAGCDARVVELVCGLTRPAGENAPTYAEWIRSIANSGDAALIIIKMADNRDNADPQRLASLPESARGMASRYENAYKALSAGLEAVKERSPGTDETNHPSP